MAVSDAPVSSRIALLPPDVANQIAAGEVVERPASVVKELVENALDAGARSITVTVDGGGLSRIAVTDDGVGMSPEDLALAVVRHATSKIRTADDLVGVATYGFRGEALPSIASVSRMRITSRPRGASEGAEVYVEGGAEAKCRPAGCAEGTTVTVEDLFFNTPARRKFLRTPQTEWAACADAVVRLALPRPDVRLVVRRDGKVARELLRRDDVVLRAKDLWPDEMLAEVRGVRGDLKLVAVLGPPERARAGANAIALYVNGRHVRDRLLLRAVAQAYGSVLEPGRYPVGALLIEVPPGDVDVNVHPQKTEVRFATQNGVFEGVVALLRESIGAAPWVRATTGMTNLWTERFGGPSSAPIAPDSNAGLVSAPAHSSAAKPLGAFVAPVLAPDPWGLTPQPPYPPTPYAAATSAAPAATGTASAQEDLLGQGSFGRLHYVAQLRRMFLVCEGEAGMVILDQHAAAERVTFDRLRRAHASRAVSVQPLLVPERVEVTAREVALAEERAEDLARIGIELTPIGPTTLSVRAVPALLTRADPRRLSRDVLAELGRHGNDFSRALDLVLATMACHGSVRAGETLADEEARALLRALDEVDFAGHCPHGRPIVWSMRWGELERRVGR